MGGPREGEGAPYCRSRRAALGLPSSVARASLPPLAWSLRQSFFSSATVCCIAFNSMSEDIACGRAEVDYPTDFYSRDQREKMEQRGSPYLVVVAVSGYEAGDVDALDRRQRLQWGALPVSPLLPQRRFEI